MLLFAYFPVHCWRELFQSYPSILVHPDRDFFGKPAKSWRQREITWSKKEVLQQMLEWSEGGIQIVGKCMGDTEILMSFRFDFFCGGSYGLPFPRIPRLAWSHVLGVIYRKPQEIGQLVLWEPVVSGQGCVEGPEVQAGECGPTAAERRWGSINFDSACSKFMQF